MKTVNFHILTRCGFVGNTNPCHNPSGPGGGQFCGGTGGYSWTKQDKLSQGILKDFGIQGITSKNDNLSLKKVNAIGEHMSEVFNNHPGLAEFVKNSSPIKLSILDSSNVSSQASGVFRNNTIIIGGRYTQGGALGFGQKRFTVDNGATGLFRHEFGHGIYERLPNQAKNDWNIRWVMGGMGQGFEKVISKYAGTNKEEGFAEAFAAWSHPKYKSSVKRLPGSIESYFNKVFNEA